MNVYTRGRQPTAKQNHPARSPFKKCSNCMARLVVPCHILWICPPCKFLYCIHIRNYIWETALCCKCTVCHILGFHYELWKSGVDLIKIANSKVLLTL